MSPNLINEALLSQNELKRLLDYDPATGVFTRRVQTSSRARVGAVAGSIDGKGYRVIRVHSRTYRIHRLAWFYIHGAWPTGDIDHINGNRSDNRIENLRSATRSENMHNQRGVRGYAWNTRRRKWTAQITVGGKPIHLGGFDTEAEARAAYLAAKKIYHPSAPESCYRQPIPGVSCRMSTTTKRGRPAVPHAERSATVTLYLGPAHLAWLDGQDSNRCAVVRKLIENAMKRRARVRGNPRWRINHP